jgi:hypothetical protein
MNTQLQAHGSPPRGTTKEQAARQRMGRPGSASQPRDAPVGDWG